MPEEHEGVEGVVTDVDEADARSITQRVLQSLRPLIAFATHHHDYIDSVQFPQELPGLLPAPGVSRREDHAPALGGRVDVVLVVVASGHDIVAPLAHGHERLCKATRIVREHPSDIEVIFERATGAAGEP